MAIGRRAWLQAISGLPLLSSLTGCGEERPAAAGALPVDETALTALVDTIVPADEDPGAVAAGIHLALLEKIKEDRWHHAVYAKGLANIDALARQRHGKRFAELDLEARDELLVSLVREFKPEYNDARRCFVTARHAVLTRFYTSPAGWRVLEYRPPRNGYDL